MALDIPLRCVCGKLRGTALGVSPRAGCRLVCYCDDCQAFARFLARPGITDDWGGTDIFQMAPASVRITHGADSLSCVRLSEKGMHRWYCGECKTPVGNTLNARIPFVGLIHTFTDHGESGQARDDALGKPLGYIYTKFAVGAPPIRTRSSLLRIVPRSVRLFGKWWVTGPSRSRAAVPFAFAPETVFAETRKAELETVSSTRDSALSS